MISGLCHTCGKPGQTFTCSLCGGQVCRGHYHPSSRTCMTCRGGKK